MAHFVCYLALRDDLSINKSKTNTLFRELLYELFFNTQYSPRVENESSDTEKLLKGTIPKN